MRSASPVASTGYRGDEEIAALPIYRLALVRLLWRHPLNLLGALLVLGVVVLALVGQMVAPYGPTTPNYSAFLSPPSVQHLFGTD